MHFAHRMTTAAEDAERFADRRSLSDCIRVPNRESFVVSTTLHRSRSGQGPRTQAEHVGAARWQRDSAQIAQC
jgi:hypothetical protein